MTNKSYGFEMPNKHYSSFLKKDVSMNTFRFKSHFPQPSNYPKRKGTTCKSTRVSYERGSEVKSNKPYSNLIQMTPIVN